MEPPRDHRSRVASLPFRDCTAVLPPSHRRRGATTGFGPNRHHRSDTASSFFKVFPYTSHIAHSRLPALLSTLVTSIVVHGHVPESMNESVIVPIIKDKNKRVNDKRNYRPICLSNICSKIIEVVLFNRMSIFLQSSPNQFGFKPKHGTELCVFAFKELLRFYKKTWFCHARRFSGCL